MAGLVLHGCPAGRKNVGSTPVAEILYHGSDCGLRSDAPMGIWLGSASDLFALDANPPGLCEAGRSLLLQHVDFEREGVLLLGLGRRSTGGYGIRLASSELEVSGNTAMLRLHLSRPAPGSRVTQALTWPCALIRIPKGEYRHIQAMDMEGLMVLKARID